MPSVECTVIQKLCQLLTVKWSDGQIMSGGQTTMEAVSHQLMEQFRRLHAVKSITSMAVYDAASLRRREVTRLLLARRRR